MSNSVSDSVSDHAVGAVGAVGTVGTAGSATLVPGAKASVLVESLPYIRRFWGKVVVVKYGGNVLSPAPGEDGRWACCRWWSTAAARRSVP